MQIRITGESIDFSCVDYGAMCSSTIENSKKAMIVFPRHFRTPQS